MEGERRERERTRFKGHSHKIKSICLEQMNAEERRHTVCTVRYGMYSFSFVCIIKNLL